jgi:WD40 repeat protein
MGAIDGDADTLPGGTRDGSAADPEAEFTVVDARFYAICEEVARGGWGLVLRAYDRRLGRMVALKQLRVTSPSVEARLRREACLTARLEHPGIVPVHEVGRFATGEPFYAMKLVEGRSLHAVFAGARSLDERLPLVPHLLAVADAVGYAHARGIIHRDLKPANVMVGAFGETLVVDWGLAKEIGAADPGPEPEATSVAPALTLAGAVVGTPPYLAPEQARGEAADPRADVYAIGAMLYTLVAGRDPYEGDTPAAIIGRVVAEPVVPLERRQPTAPRDLIAIVAKAMAREPGGRYPTARELADDLRRFLAGRLVAAQSYSSLVLLRRWLARHVRAVVVTLVGLALAAALAVAGENLRRAHAIAEVRRAELTLAHARAALDADPTRAVALLKRHVPADDADAERAAAVSAEAASRTVARHVFRNVRLAAVSRDGRWIAGRNGPDLSLVRTDGAARIELHDPDGERITGSSFAPDGARLAAIAGNGATLRLWDVGAGSGRELLRSTARLMTVTWHPDGRSLAVTTSDGRVLAIEAGSGAVRERRVADVFVAEFSPDGHTLAATTKGAIHVLGDDAPDFVALPEPGGDLVAFAPDSARLAWPGRDGAIVVYDLRDRSLRPVGRPGAQVLRLVFSPDGRGLLSAAVDGSVRLWDLAGAEARAMRLPGAEPAYNLAVSPDGTLVAVGGAKGALELWDLASGTARALLGHHHELWTLAFSADGDLLVSADRGGQARVWSLARPAARAVAARVAGAEIGAGGEVVAMRASGGLDVWNARTGAVRHVELAAGSGPQLRVAADGGRAATVAGATIQVTDLASGAVVPVVNPATVRAFALAPDGRTLAVADDDKRVRVLATDGATPARDLGVRTQIPIFARFAPGGTELLNATISLVRLERLDGAGDRRFAPGDLVTQAEFAPDGKRLAIALIGGRIWLWAPDAGSPVALDGHTAGVNQLAFAPDGATLASAGDDQAVWLWRPGTRAGRRLAHLAPVTGVAFLDGGARLASSSGDGAVRLWDVASGRELAVVRIGDAPLEGLFFIAGKLVAAGAEHLWHVDLPSAAPPALAALTSAEVLGSEDGLLATPGTGSEP